MSPAHTVSNSYETTRNVLDVKANAANGANPSVVSAFDYSVNNLGQRDDVSRTGSAFTSANTETWNYNAKGEVVTANHSTNNAFDRAFEFDGIGNRKKSADSITLPTADNYIANTLNQLTTVNGGARIHDEDGNLTDDGSKLFVWDAENRLIEIKLKSDDSAVATYAYDYQSRRITKTVGSTVTNFVYDGWNPIAEYTSALSPLSFTLSTSYTWGMDLSGSMQGAGGVGGLLSVNEASATYYPTFDGNGNVSEYVDATGVVVAHYEYDAFGQVVASGSKKDDFTHQFSTKQLDSESGLHYYGYRYYDSSNGRWPSRDPIQEKGGINLYNFVGNDSINRWDLLGQRWSKKGTIKDGARRLWKRTKPSTDTLEKLAKKVKLDPQEAGKWAKKEDPTKCGLKAGDTGCCFSVPNVFVVSDLLGYDKLDDAVITTGGGRLGRLFTFTGGRKRVNAHTADKMHAALKKHKGDLWGYIVYAHGANNQIGTLHATRRGGPITNAVKIYQDLKGNGFQLSKVWMMQCFSAAHGRDAWWKDVSYRDPKYYFGVNTCGIDVK